MTFHMRTTLVIDDEVMREIKKRVAAEGRTLSAVTEEVMRWGLATSRPSRPRRAARLPSFSMGKPIVDIADRDQLLEVTDPLRRFKPLHPGAESRSPSRAEEPDRFR